MPHPHHHSHPVRHLGLIGFIAVSALCTTLQAAESTAAGDAKVQYERERAVCMTGKSNQDQATCLKEAGAAYDQVRHGQLDNTSGNYRKNAMLRCESQPEADRAECRARIGKGSTDGSAASGGIIREHVTTVPAPAAPQ